MRVKEFEFIVIDAGSAQTFDKNRVHPRDDTLGAERQERGAFHRMRFQAKVEILAYEVVGEIRKVDCPEVYRESLAQESAEQFRVPLFGAGAAAFFPEILGKPRPVIVIIAVGHQSRQITSEVLRI